MVAAFCQHFTLMQVTKKKTRAEFALRRLFACSFYVRRTRSPSVAAFDGGGGGDGDGGGDGGGY